MKKTVSILAILFVFMMTAQAQKKEKKQEKEKLSIAQQTTLSVKKMTLKLDLTAAQQRKITPLITAQLTDKNNMREKRRTAKKNKKRPTADERYKMANARLDKEIAFKKSMKEILNEVQFAKFEKMKQYRKGNKRMKIKKKKAHKKGDHDN